MTNATPETTAIALRGQHSEIVAAKSKTKETNDTDACEAFGLRLTTAMDKAGISQAELARFLGKSRSAINWWVRGATYPSIDHAKELARFLKTTPEWLLFGTTEVQPERLSESIPVINHINGRDVEVTRITLPSDFMARTNMPDTGKLRAISIFGDDKANIVIADTSDKELTVNKPKVMVIDWYGKIDVATASLKRGDHATMVVDIDGVQDEMPYKQVSIIGRLTANIEATVTI